MKLKIVLILAFVGLLVVSIAGCTNTNVDKEPTNNVNTATSTPTLTPVPTVTTPTPTPVPTVSTPTPTPLIATTTSVWAPPLVGPDTITNPGQGMGTSIAQGTDWWYCRAVVNAADGTHPCGHANWYIDDQAAGGVWSNTDPGLNGLPGCSSGMGFARLELHSADTLKLSVGYHTLKCDFLGNGAYAPSEWVGRIYIAAPTAT